MENFPPQSPSLKNNEFLHVASVSNTIDNKMLYAERLVIELSNPDLRENALHLLSKVCTNTSFNLWGLSSFFFFNVFALNSQLSSNRIQLFDKLIHTILNVNTLYERFKL